MTWCEEFVKDFDGRERCGETSIMVHCLTKLGHNIFTDDTEPFTKWLDSFIKNALYKALLNAPSAKDR